MSRPFASLQIAVAKRLKPLSVLAALCLSFGAQMARAESPVTEGSWSTLPYPMPINPIHVGLLHTGKVLVVAGSENIGSQHEEEEYYGAVWDPASGTITVQNLLWDIFCTGMSAMPDGRYLIVGATSSYNPFYGDSLASVFDPVTEKFAQAEYMAHGRWYATSTVLADGSTMAFSGLTELNQTNMAVELYNVGSGWSPEYIAPWKPPLYPRMHLLPDGTVFYSGPTSISSIFNPSTKAWTVGVAETIKKTNRRGGSSVLLALRPSDGYAARLMVVGGDSPGSPTAEVIDLSAATLAWREVGEMGLGRIRLNATLLPNGKILASGGSIIDEDPNTASLTGDLYDPATETWSPAGLSVFPRLYHSSAILLPDATVWVAGSNPDEGIYEDQMEIYSPPYLFTADPNGNVILATRPVITSVSSKVGYNARLNIRTPDAASISQVVIMRPGSATHSFDFDQRLIELAFTVSRGTIVATAPPTGAIAPARLLHGLSHQSFRRAFSRQVCPPELDSEKPDAGRDHYLAHPG